MKNGKEKDMYSTKTIVIASVVTSALTYIVLRLLWPI